MKDEKDVVDLPSGVYVDPKLAVNPAVARYAQALAARKGGAPVAGGPTPPVPRFDMPASEGMTMADQARAMRQPRGPDVSSIFSPVPDGSGLLQTDLLPEAARGDAAYQEGHGSMYAVNQRHLANKYGVVRNGKFVPPQALHTVAPGLSKETIGGLEAVAAFNKQRQKAESPEAGSEAGATIAASAGTSGEVARLADPSENPSPQPVDQEDIRRAVENMDDFDFDSFRDLIMKDILNNAEQKEIVESRLEPLDLGDIIDHGTIRQKIPINPGKYEVVLQSVTGEEELAMKRLIVSEKGKVDAPDRYLLDKFRLMMCALGLYAVNKRVLPDHRDQRGDFDEDMFWQKFNLVLKLPFHMLASVATHYYYFDIRVRSLFKAVKNG